MSGFVDIHAHVLPGIDDGPRDLDGSLAMARAAVASGITTIAATPHLRSDFPDVHVRELAGRCQQLREAFEHHRIPLRLVSGAEVSLSWALDANDEELRLASYNQQGTDLLIETPSSNIFGLDHILYELRRRGYRITLAHPERSSRFADHESQLRALADQGVLLQINAGSLLGHTPRSGPRRIARRLCSQGLAHVIASDAHRAADWRPVTELGEGVEQAADLLGEERAHWLAAAVPVAIIEGAQVPDPPPLRRRLRRVFGVR